MVSGIRQDLKEQGVLGTIFITLFVFSLFAGLISLFLLLPSTFYQHSQVEKCERYCQKNACSMTMEEKWCYEWEDCGPTWLPETESCCIGSNLSTKEACVNDCWLNYCPQKTPWKYTIITGIPILFFILLIGVFLFIDKLRRQN